jgi:hypothetical protein
MKKILLIVALAFHCYCFSQQAMTFQDCLDLALRKTSNSNLPNTIRKMQPTNTRPATENCCRVSLRRPKIKHLGT